MKKALFIPVVLLATCLTSQAFAQMYKWLDKNGEVHYTQTPPPADAKQGKDIENDIRLSTGKLGNTPPAAKTNEPTKDNMAKAREDGKKSEAEHRDYCKQQAGTIKQLTANAVVKWKDDKGERILTAEEKTNKIQELEKNIKTLCMPEMFDKTTTTTMNDSSSTPSVSAKPSTPENVNKTAGDSNKSTDNKDKPLTDELLDSIGNMPKAQ